jgi:hypothetical protein
MTPEINLEEITVIYNLLPSQINYQTILCMWASHDAINMFNRLLVMLISDQSSLSA